MLSWGSAAGMQRRDKHPPSLRSWREHGTQRSEGNPSACACALDFLLIRPEMFKSTFTWGFSTCLA